MSNTMNKANTKRFSHSWRKHVRRLKQQARKTGAVYTVSRPAISIPQAPKKLPDRVEGREMSHTSSVV